jgi:GT2 family glycosyltransferase
VLPNRLAILVTCHDRRATTLRCLHALSQSAATVEVAWQLYLVADGCSDGTPEAAREEFPEAVVLEGNGALSWCGGMRLAWGRAVSDECDCFLWLNDDTFVYRHALADLLNTREQVLKALHSEPVVVGSCRDPDTGCHTYGGYRRRHRWTPLVEDRVPPRDQWFRCDTMNGNLVLVPLAVVNQIGILSRDFTHLLADQDYGYRAARAGIPVVVAAGYLAECRRDGWPRPWMDARLPLKERMANMLSPKGFPPKEWLVYTRRHGGWLWPYHYVKPWVKVAFPWLSQCAFIARHAHDNGVSL